ncbi:phosphatidylcholine/phosphatidylserine synthase [bacterium]|nr:phosphatidylcholine/phosphatidylserine synthase [bacterium]
MNPPWKSSAKKKVRESKSSRWRKRRERAKKGLAILPSLLTLGNAVCGIAAIVKVAKIQWIPPDIVHPERFDPWTNLYEAALLILLGMVFDMLDGRVARITRTTSDFGAELDSLCDAVTFGVAPALVTIMANGEAHFPGSPFWTKVAWLFGIAYACGAISRLARFNVETDDHDEKSHLEFKGLPSPAAAGVVATLIMLQGYLLGPRAKNLTLVDPGFLQHVGSAITYVLPFAALACGYLMVSTFRYAHVANRWLKGRKPFDYLGIIILLGVLLGLLPEVVLALSFGLYALSGPLLAWRRRGTAPQLTVLPLVSDMPAVAPTNGAAHDGPRAAPGAPGETPAGPASAPPSPAETR